MRSPIAKGRVSSPYGNRGGSFHAGIDIAATGGYGTPVAAAFAGKVVKVVRGRKHGDRSRVNELAPYRTGNGVIIQNPDGERQLYGHVTPAVKVGQQVAEGELVGHVDDSGNTTGPHVHYEEWTRTGATRDPMVSFRHFGVTPGKGIAPAPAKPKPKPSTPSKGEEPSVGIKGRLKKMGLPQTAAGVVAWQRAHGLYQDGLWGPVCEAYYQWVLKLQRYLNTWKNVKRYYPNGIPVDGYRGATTKKAEGYAKAGATARVPYSPPKEPAKRA